MIKRSDNSRLRHKLALRRYFLDAYHKEHGNILDCCQGSKVIWTTLCAEYPHLEYWGVDLKKQAGRIRISSDRILAQPGWAQDIIDIDTYGSPWKHYLGMMPFICRPITVFLTIGTCSNLSNMTLAAKKAIGIEKLHIPPMMGRFLNDFAVKYLLTQVVQYGILIVEAVEAVSTGNARYIGLRLEPKQ